MDNKIKNYISAQPEERHEILSQIHSIIMQEDRNVVSTIESMMGKEMIMYKQNGLMKYALSSVKNYMSLHAMPIYATPKLFSKYQSLLNKAVFQKGCINFDTAEEMPLEIVRKFVADCADFDLFKIRQEYLAEKKLKNEAKTRTP